MMTFRARADWLAHIFKAATQQHHGELAEVFRPYIAEDGVVFDVGAHAGQFSKLFARLAPAGTVFAFEPSAYARSVLKPALAWNRVRNIEIVPMGMSDTPGSLTLSSPIKRRGGIGFGLAHLGEEPEGKAVLKQTVDLTTMDRFFQDRGLTRLDFVKADIEGWEAHALRGGRETIAAHRPTLFIEINEASLARAGSTPADIWDQLAPLGYRALKAPDFETVPGFTGAGDYLFVA